MNYVKSSLCDVVLLISVFVPSLATADTLTEGYPLQMAPEVVTGIYPFELNDGDNAESIMEIATVYYTGQWAKYWKTERKAA